MVKPPDARIKNQRKVKQLKPNGFDPTLPTYTVAINAKYNGIEGLRPRMESVLKQTGNIEAYNHTLRSLPTRSLSTNKTLNPRHQYGVTHPILDRSIVNGKPFGGLDLLGYQHKTRFNQGNVDYKQKPLLIWSQGAPNLR